MYILLLNTGISTQRPYVGGSLTNDGDYIEICACNVDLCNSFVASSSAAAAAGIKPPPTFLRSANIVATEPSQNSQHRNAAGRPSSFFSYSYFSNSPATDFVPQEVSIASTCILHLNVFLPLKISHCVNLKILPSLMLSPTTGHR